MGRNLSTLLKELLVPSQLDLIQCVAEEATALGFPLYIVGGFVATCCLAGPTSILILSWKETRVPG